MRISQIKDQINKNYIEIKELQSRISTLSSKNNNLIQCKKLKLIDYFKEYIEIGFTYNVSVYFSVSGVQTGVKKDEAVFPFFNIGDAFEVIKKNNKTFVIRQTKKVVSFYINGIKQNKITEPNYVFRVDIIDLYETICSRDKTFCDSFEKYVTRKESLEMLNI